MDVRIKNGTPLDGESLCESCVHAHIEKGFRDSERIVICHATYPDHRVLFRVRECSEYTEVKRQTLRQMEEIAWVLAPREGERKAGFVPARELEKESDVELILDESE